MNFVEFFHKFDTVIGNFLKDLLITGRIAAW
jgi:hypothetical protein